VLVASCSCEEGSLLCPLLLTFSSSHHPVNMSLNIAALSQAALEARGLAMDAIQKAASGHLGLPLGCAELGATLYGHALRHNPDKPEWLNRDVFVLSAGHGSMFLYSWLHLAGYAVQLDDIKQFRQLSSTTPGHPEFRDTPGVEATTGPLGQGVGNAVGYAVAAKMTAAHFNTKDHKIFDQKVVCLAGDGCLQEGVAAEASAFAGHFKLDNLILFYDSNDVTLDAMAIETQSEDTAQRYAAYGFEVQEVKEGQNLERILEAYEKAKNSTSGKPQLIILKTTIAKGIPEVAGTNKGHSEAGVKFVDASRKALGLPDEKFFVSKGTRDYFQAHKEKLLKDYASWEKLYNEWRSANPQLAALLDSAKDAPEPSKLFSVVPKFPEAPIATRKAGSEVLQPLAKALPLFISGSADLHGSTLNYIAGGEDFTPKSPTGKTLKSPIR
jgi:transketolase